jgi:hypothetical protein
MNGELAFSLAKMPGVKYFIQYFFSKCPNHSKDLYEHEKLQVRNFWENISS